MRVYLSAHGNDGTGCIGNRRLPFQTIEAAIAALRMAGLSPENVVVIKEEEDEG